MDGGGSQFNKTRNNTKCTNNGKKEAMTENLEENIPESNLENINTATKKL